MEEAEEAESLKVQPQRQCQNFIRGAMKYLVPILTEALTRQEDEPEEDAWNVAMAAGTCLSLVAMTVGDEVVAYVMPFVQQYINNENWKYREAATLAFGTSSLSLLFINPYCRCHLGRSQGLFIAVNLASYPSTATTHARFRCVCERYHGLDDWACMPASSPHGWRIFGQLDHGAHRKFG